MRMILIALVVGATSLSSCLVHSRCVSDSDCEGNERCGDDGECALECTEELTDACPADRPMCREETNRCVACLESDDCDDGRCVNWVCIPELIHNFTLVDRNSTSPTFDQEISLSDHLGEVVLIFFAGLG